jgi:hypothetical protein
MAGLSIGEESRNRGEIAVLVALEFVLLVVNFLLGASHYKFSKCQPINGLLPP